MVVGLGFTPYSLHRRLKCNLNSLPLSNMIFLQRGYLQNQHLLTKLLTMSEDLSKHASLAFFSFSVGTMSSTGSSTISNQLLAGSIIVRHMKSNSVLSLPLRVYVLLPRCAQCMFAHCYAYMHIFLLSPYAQFANND